MKIAPDTNAGNEGIGREHLIRIADDVLIAVSCARAGAVVVTRNERDFFASPKAYRYTLDVARLIRRLVFDGGMPERPARKPAIVIIFNPL